MKFSVVSLDGKAAGTMTAPEAIWEVPANAALIAQVLHVYHTNQRRGTARTKDRTDIKVTSRKMWQQKGTGRARHGDASAPQFVGGGVAHGPALGHNYEMTINKKMLRKALFVSLSEKVRQKKLTVVEDLSEMVSTSKKLSTVIAKVTPSKRTLVVLDKYTPILTRAGRNLPFTTVTFVNQLSPYLVLSSQHLVFTKNAISAVSTHFSHD